MSYKSTLIAICLIPMASLAQPPEKQGPNPDRKRIESMEVAYMTRELNLSPEEAQKFWPVFNKYREEVKAVNTNTAITDPLDKQQKVLDIRKKYRTEFGRVLGPDKGQSVFTSEDQFRHMVRGAMQMRKKAAERRPNMQQRFQQRRRSMPGGGF
jgi:hypothetical protein